MEEFPDVAAQQLPADAPVNIKVEKEIIISDDDEPIPQNIKLEVPTRNDHAVNENTMNGTAIEEIVAQNVQNQTVPIVGAEEIIPFANNANNENVEQNREPQPEPSTSTSGSGNRLTRRPRATQKTKPKSNLIRKKNFQCESCAKSFIKNSDLIGHRRQHLNEIRFHCSNCFHGFHSATAKVKHEAECKLFRFECYICKIYCPGKSHLKIHMKIHMKGHNIQGRDNFFDCEICGVKFTTLASARNHKSFVHQL